MVHSRCFPCCITDILSLTMLANVVLKNRPISMVKETVIQQEKQRECAIFYYFFTISLIFDAACGQSHKK